MSLKKKFLKYLLAFTIFLMIVNVVIELFSRSPVPDDGVYHELTIRQIDSVFVDVLDQYGIESKWISSKNIEVADEDSLTKRFTVMLPSDLPIPLIIRDVHSKIENDITGFASEEKKIFGSTEIRIYTNEKLKLMATLIPDPQIIRDRNNITFIFRDAADLNQTDFNRFLSFPYKFSLTLIPGSSTARMADTLKNYSKEYAVLLNDEIDEDKYRIAGRDNKVLLKNSINNIIKDFSDASCFVIDEGSRLHNSVSYNFIRDEFKKRNRELIPLSEIILIDSERENELVSKFKFHCMDGSGSRQKTFLITFDNYLIIQSELELFKKKGHRIVPLSQVDFIKG